MNEAFRIELQACDASCKHLAGPSHLVEAPAAHLVLLQRKPLRRGTESKFLLAELRCLENGFCVNGLTFKKIKLAHMCFCLFRIGREEDDC
ncbi:MAG: hypothetical protein BVN35_21240 [Proteobacteria bacterium ST_bin11]|nr:MAG: hypothetical protein BVN35_21240 [Proteobacteria bacterium ST_bin11]